MTSRWALVALVVLVVACSCRRDRASREAKETALDESSRPVSEPPRDAGAASPTLAAGPDAAPPPRTVPPRPQPSSVPVTPELLSKLEDCRPYDGFEPGDMPPVKVETIGTRPPSEAVHVFGQSTRYYAFFGVGMSRCATYPVKGKPLGYAKGDFLGTGGVQKAFLIGDELNDDGLALSIKDESDRLVDAIALDCRSAQVETIHLFDDRDTLNVHCGRGGQDGGYAILSHVFDYRQHVLLETERSNPLYSGVFDGLYSDACERYATSDVSVASQGPEPSVIVMRELYTDQEIQRWTPSYRGIDPCMYPMLFTTWTYTPTKRAFERGAQRAALRRVCTCKLDDE